MNTTIISEPLLKKNNLMFRICFFCVFIMTVSATNNTTKSEEPLVTTEIGAADISELKPEYDFIKNKSEELSIRTQRVSTEIIDNY